MAQKGHLPRQSSRPQEGTKPSPGHRSLVPPHMPYPRSCPQPLFTHLLITLSAGMTSPCTRWLATTPPSREGLGGPGSRTLRGFGREEQKQEGGQKQRYHGELTAPQTLPGQAGSFASTLQSLSTVTLCPVLCTWLGYHGLQPWWRAEWRLVGQSGDTEASGKQSL